MMAAAGSVITLHLTLAAQEEAIAPRRDVLIQADAFSPCIKPDLVNLAVYGVASPRAALPRHVHRVHAQHCAEHSCFRGHAVIS